MTGGDRAPAGPSRWKLPTARTITSRGSRCQQVVGADLERLRPRTVITVAGGAVAAHVLATQLSTVNIAGTLQHARPSWVAVALLGSALTYFGAALARQAFAPVRVPLTRTARVQLASSFLTLVTPPAVGQVSINIRYLQRAGAPTAAAAASVGVSEAVTAPA